jgi:hypothetical protein
VAEWTPSAPIRNGVESAVAVMDRDAGGLDPVQQDPVQVGPADHHVGGAVAAGLVAGAEPADATAGGVGELDAGRGEAGGADRLGQSQRPQCLDPVGCEVQEGPTLARAGLGGGLHDLDVVTGAVQGQGQRQPADAGPGNGDRHLWVPPCRRIFGADERDGRNPRRSRRQPDGATGVIPPADSDRASLHPVR